MNYRKGDRIAVRGYDGIFIVIGEGSPRELVRCYPQNSPNLEYEFPQYKITKL